MAVKQISLSIPETLYQASVEYKDELGYKNLQELLLELLRNRVTVDRLARYKHIESEMSAGKKRRLNKKEAIQFLRKL